MSELPRGWMIGRLGEVLPIQYGKALSAVQRDSAGSQLVYGSNGCVGTHSSSLTDGPALIIGRKGAAGAIHFSSGPCWVIDTAYFTQFAEVLDLRFASHLLSHCRLGSLDRSTAIPSLSRDDYSNVEVPIPPYAEQERIRSKLEELLTDLDAGVAALERARATLKRYRASVLKAAVEGRLTAAWREAHPDVEPASKLLERILAERRKRWEERQLAKFAEAGKVPPKDWRSRYLEPSGLAAKDLPSLPEGWCWTTVDAVGDVLLGRQRAPQFLRGDHPRQYLRVANIKDDRIDFGDLETMDFDPEHFAKYRLLVGDILVSEGQSPELVGQSAIYRGEVDDLCFQKTLHRFRAVVGSIPAEFAQLVFRAHVRSGVFRRLASITTNIAHLTLEKFCAAPFPLPPIEEQREILRVSDLALTSIARIEAHLNEEGIRAASLRQSILKRAFEGRLVPQDPKDEPAAVLLERIRAERAGTGNPTGGRDSGIDTKVRQGKRGRRIQTR